MNLVPFQKELPHPCASDRLCADKEPQQWVRGLISGRCLLLLIPLIPLSFLTPLFCSSVLTPFPFLSLQAPPEQVGLLAPQNRRIFLGIFGGWKCSQVSLGRTRSAFSSSAIISKVHSSGIFCNPPPPLLALLVPDSLDLDIKAGEFFALLFPPYRGSRFAGQIHSTVVFIQSVTRF